MTRSNLDRQVESRLTEREIRYTKGRRTVVKAMSQAGGPMSAAELSRVVGPSIPVSSLYRTLSVLEGAGVVAPHLGAKGLTRYELAEWLTGHHHHLVCTDWGAVDDVEIPLEQEEGVRSLVAQISALAAFAPTDHALEIEGTCARCA
jgi:Fe2+ or Zn2+ uptake regulation protein